MDSRLAFTLVFIAGLAAIALAARRAITICTLAVREGELTVARGGIAPRILVDLADVVRKPRVMNASIRIFKSAGRAEIAMTGDLSEAQRQQIRNVVGSVPLSKLTNARKLRK